MNDLLPIACGAGLRDGLNPCIFMACAVFIAGGFWLKKNSLRVGFLYFIFALSYAAGTLIFNFGPAQILVFQKSFIFAAKVLYFVLGAGSFILGVLFLKDWFSLNGGLPSENLTDEKIKSFTASSFPVRLMIIILALVFSAFATLWPINNYMMLLGNEALLKGQWQMIMPILLGYVFISMWPLWFVWSFLSIRNLRPSLLKIVCSAVFFTASSVMILIFK